MYLTTPFTVISVFAAVSYAKMSRYRTFRPYVTPLRYKV